MTTDEIHYQGYRSGDERRIIDLYNREFSTPMTPELWQWAYAENPVGRFDISLAWSGDTLVGHTAGTPLVLRQGSQELQACRLQHALVHPEFHRRGIFTETLRHIAGHLSANSVDLVFGFTNDTRNSFPGMLKGGFDHLFDIFPFTQRVDALPARRDASVRIAMEEPPRFRQEDVDCVALHLGSCTIFNSRTLSYLNWRFRPESGKRYVLARAFRDDGQVGWAVGKAFAAGGSIDVVELFVPPEAVVVIGMLRGLVDHFRGLPLDSFSLWSMPHYPLHASLTELGFVQGPLATHFTYRALSDRCSSDCQRVSSYYLAMGDSDVY
jgi:GNAT superfamily N-acetyltransferase